MKNFFLINLLITALLNCSVSFSQNYCNFDNSLFLVNQPQAIDSQIVTYAYSQWSLDEWDNSVGCTVPIINVPQCENLDMLVYYPVLPPNEYRPLIVLIHGGGFIEGNYNDFRQQARNFARLGYVTATINYRLCKRNDCLIAQAVPFGICNVSFGNSLIPAAYIALLDACNAIRYLQQNAATYHIDPNNIIVGGHSAGAWTSAHIAYLDQDEINAIAPNLEANFGSINKPTGIRGIVCMSGALIDLNIIDADEDVPVFIIHGTCDAVLPYNTGNPYQCADYPTVYGGGAIAQRLHQLGHPYYLFTGQNMGHDISPLMNVWTTEVLRFARQNVLCGEFIQKHTVTQLTPAVTDCTISSQALMPLPQTPVWGSLPVGVDEEYSSVTNVKIMPTITDNWITIKNGSLGTMHLYDITGKLLQTNNLSQNTLDVSLQNYPIGMYLVKICDKQTNNVVVYKVIKQ